MDGKLEFFLDRFLRYSHYRKKIDILDKKYLDRLPNLNLVKYIPPGGVQQEQTCSVCSFCPLRYSVSCQSLVLQSQSNSSKQIVLYYLYLIENYHFLLFLPGKLFCSRGNLRSDFPQDPFREDSDPGWLEILPANLQRYQFPGGFCVGRDGGVVVITEALNWQFVGFCYTVQCNRNHQLMSMVIFCGDITTY